MKAIVHPILMLETCTRLVAYLVAWTIRAHRYLVRIESEFIRVPNSYALEAAALRRWRGQDDPAAAFLLHIFGGSPHGVHLTLEEMHRWMGFIISGLGIAEGIWALHFSLGGRVDFHLVCSNATHLGGPLHNHHLIRRLQELAQQATEDLNTRRLAAGLLPIGCLTIEGRVYYPDLRIEILKVPSHETAPRVDFALPIDNVELSEAPTPERSPVRPVPERTGPLPPINDPTVAPRWTGPANEPSSSNAAATAPDSAAGTPLEPVKAPSPAVNCVPPELPRSETPSQANLTPTADTVTSPKQPPVCSVPEPAPKKPLPGKSAAPIAAGAPTKTKAQASSTAAATDGATDTGPELLNKPPTSQPKNATPSDAAKVDPNVPAYEWERRIKLLANLAAEDEAYASDRKRRREEAEKQYLTNGKRWSAEARSFVSQPTPERDHQLQVVQDFIDAMEVTTSRMKERQRIREAPPQPRDRSDSMSRA